MAGAAVPSVTKVLGVISKGDALIQWSANAVNDFYHSRLQPGLTLSEAEIAEWYSEAKSAHRRLSMSATDIGSEAHRWIEGLLEARLSGTLWENLPTWVPEHPQIGNCCNAAYEWLKAEQVEPLEVERRLFSKKFKYAGTADLIAKIGDELVLVDWKSSKAIYPEYYLQTAAYVKALEEERPELKFGRRILVRLGKEDGAFEAVELPRSTFSRDWRGFKGALDLFNWKQSIG